MFTSLTLKYRFFSLHNTRVLCYAIFHRIQIRGREITVPFRLILLPCLACDACGSAWQDFDRLACINVLVILSQLRACVRELIRSILCCSTGVGTHSLTDTNLLIRTTYTDSDCKSSIIILAFLSFAYI